MISQSPDQHAANSDAIWFFCSVMAVGFSKGRVKNGLTEFVQSTGVTRATQAKRKEWSRPDKTKTENNTITNISKTRHDRIKEKGLPGQHAANRDASWFFCSVMLFGRSKGRVKMGWTEFVQSTGVFGLRVRTQTQGTPSMPHV